MASPQRNIPEPVFKRKRLEEYRTSPAEPGADTFIEEVIALWADLPEDECKLVPQSDEIDEFVYGVSRAAE